MLEIYLIGSISHMDWILKDDQYNIITNKLHASQVIESESESEYLFNIIYAILINNLNNMVIQ